MEYQHDHHDGHKRVVIEGECYELKKCDPPHPKEESCCECAEHAKKGRLLSISASLVPVAPVGADIPLVLLSNPAGSGKYIHLCKALWSSIGTSDKGVKFSVYTNPAISAPGPALAVANSKQTVPPQAYVPAAQASSGPTVMANGAFFGSFVATYGSLSSDLNMILGPGTSLLVTASVVALGTDAYLDLSWYER